MNAINELNKLHAARQLELRTENNELKVAQSAELETLRKQHRTDINTRDKAFEATLAALKADMQKRCSVLQSQIDAKDAQLIAEKKDHTDKQMASERQYEEWKKKINANHFAKVMKLQTELSLLVKVKKAEMMAQIAKMEEQRSAYELRINDLDAQIKKLSISELNLKSTVSELQTALARLKDVEQQLIVSRQSEE